MLAVICKTYGMVLGFHCLLFVGDLLATDLEYLAKSCLGMVTEIRNPMGFYSIRTRVWVRFCTRGSINGFDIRPVGFVSMGLG